MAEETKHGGYVTPDGSVSPQPAKIRVAVPKPKKALPSKEALVDLALDVYRLALDNQRVYVNKHGEEKATQQPDFKAAVLAARLVGELCGHLGSRAKEVKRPEEADDEAVDVAEAAIEKLRSKLARASQ